MAPDRFEAIDFQVKAVLVLIEGRIPYTFREPMLLLEALQFPGSHVRWSDSKNNKGLSAVGEFVIGLAAAAGEYRHSGLTDSRVIENIPDDMWLQRVVFQRGMDMGLRGLMGSGGREVHEHTAVELLPLTTGAVMGAIYIDGGMEAVASVLGDYVDYMAQADSGREHEGIVRRV